METHHDQAADNRLNRREVLRLTGRSTLAVAAASSVTGLLAACGSDNDDDAKSGGKGGGLAADRPYKIGFIAPLTGPVAPEGQALKRGFDMGVAQINAAGGIGGQPIEVTSQDDASSPAQAATVAKKLILQEKVDLLYGGITTDEADVISKLATQAKVPHVYVESGEWRPNCDTATLKLGETAQQLITPLVPFMAERFGTRWALVGNDYSYPRAYLEFAKSQFDGAGIEVVTETYAPLGTADYSSVVGKLKAARPDVVLSAVVGGDAIALVKSAASLGLLRDSTITGPSLQPEFYPAMGDAIEGCCVAQRYAQQIATKANRQFVAAYQGKYGRAPIPLVATTARYGVDAVKAAVTKAGDYDREAVIDAFQGLSFPSMLSDRPLTVAANNFVDYEMYICQVKPGGGSQIVDRTGKVVTPQKC